MAGSSGKSGLTLAFLERHRHRPAISLLAQPTFGHSGRPVRVSVTLNTSVGVAAGAWSGTYKAMARR